eukprot:gene6986-11152_t
MKQVVFFILLFISFCFASELPLTKTEVDNFHKILQNKKETKQDVHYSVASLLKLGEKIGKYGISKEELCPLIKTKVFDPKTLYHMSASIAGLGCDKTNLKALEGKILNNLSKTSSKDLFFTARSIFLLRKKFSSLPKDKQILNQMFNILMKKYNSDTGLFCQKSESCLEETGFAYNALTTLHSLLLFQNSVDSNIISNMAKVASKVNMVLVSLFEKKTSLATKASVLSGINRIASIIPLKSKITKKDINLMKDKVLSHRSEVKSIEDLYNFFEAFSSIVTNNIKVPVYFSALNVDKTNHKVSIDISDYFGKQLNGKILLQRVSNSADEDENIVEDVELQSTGTNYEWSYEKHKKSFESGVINLEFTFNPTKKTESLQSVTVIRKIKFDTEIEIEDFRFFITQLNQRTRSIVDTSNYRVKYPGKLEQKIKVGIYNSLGVAFHVVGPNSKEFQPHQVFLRLIHLKTQRERSFVIRRVNHEYRIEIEILKAVEKVFGNRRGDYDVEIVVADEVVKNPLLWKVGTVTLDITHKQSKKDYNYSPKPEITHIFRPAAKRPNVLVSRVVTIAVFVPLLFFVFSLLFAGPNLTGCPSGFGFIQNFILQVCILLMLLVIVAYWVQLSIFQAFGALATLGSIAVLIGTFGLRAVNKKK